MDNPIRHPQIQAGIDKLRWSPVAAECAEKAAARILSTAHYMGARSAYGPAEEIAGFALVILTSMAPALQEGI